MLSFVLRLWNMALNLLFPQTPLLHELLRMDAVEFSKRASRTKERAGDGIISLFEYADPLVRRAVWELKYRGNKRVAALLASVLYDELLGFLEEYAPLTNFTDPLLVPIPLSRKRERERGFNQCELLCNELVLLDSPFVKGSGESPSRGISSPPTAPFQRGSTESARGRGSEGGAGGGRISLTKGSTAVFGGEGCRGRNFTLSPTALRKIKDTPSQTKTDGRAKREKNLKGCFSASREVSGRNIILIDDVATTGATLAEARRALRAAGARKVIAFTLAH